MSVIVILILISLAMALTALLTFVWAVRSGQFEDTCTPAMRILTEEESPTLMAGSPAAAAQRTRKHRGVRAPGQPIPLFSVGRGPLPGAAEACDLPSVHDEPATGKQTI